LDITRYKQASGRAGRMGKDTIGESFLLGENKRDESICETLISSELPQISSCLDPQLRGNNKIIIKE
jgi:DNA polymerase theta